MMIAGFTAIGVERTINELKNKGYRLEEISVVKKIDQEKTGKNDLGEIITFIEPEIVCNQLQEVISRSSVLPLLDDLLVSGPLAMVSKISMLKSTLQIQESDSEELNITEIRAVCDRNINRKQVVISELLLNIGVPSENSFFFSQIVNSGGILLVIPEKGDNDLYDILLSHGALRIYILEEDGQPVRGRL